MRARQSKRAVTRTRRASLSRRRQPIHALLDSLPEPHFVAAKSYIEYLRACASRPDLPAEWAALAVNETLTAEEEARVATSRRQIARGETVPLAALLKETSRDG